MSGLELAHNQFKVGLRDAMNAHVESEAEVVPRIREMGAVGQARHHEWMLRQDGVPQLGQIRQPTKRHRMRRRHLDAGFAGDAGTGEG